MRVAWEVHAFLKEQYQIIATLARINDLLFQSQVAEGRFDLMITLGGDGTMPDSRAVILASGEKVGFDPSGFDAVEFLIAPNPGEGLKPLVKIASGGETSRLMLALKNVLAQADYVPTLIFDEIDQGIGGRIGSVVGEKLWNLSLAHQVMCVTHLPQLAAFGDQHYHVHKEVTEGRTSTVVERLDENGRIVELAQMTGSISESNLNAAREMIVQARQRQKELRSS